MVTDIRITQIFLRLLYASSAWFSFHDFILSLTKLLHTWLLSNSTQVTMNARKSIGWREIWAHKLRLAWDLSPFQAAYKPTSVTPSRWCVVFITERNDPHSMGSLEKIKRRYFYNWILL